MRDINHTSHTNKMRGAYAIEHWALTLLLAPVTGFIREFFSLPNPHKLEQLLEIYPSLLLLSIAFSLPTFFVYFFCFFLLHKGSFTPAISKFVLITIAVLGIWITQISIGGNMSIAIIVAYSITAVLVGLMLKLKLAKEKIP